MNALIPYIMKKLVMSGKTLMIVFLIILLSIAKTGWGQTSVGPTIAGTGASVDGPGTESWLNPEYITADDANYATAALPGYVSYNYVSELLQGTGCGFTIPDGVTIRGIEVKIMRRSSSNNQNTWSVKDASLYLLKEGTVAGSDRADLNTCWPEGMTEASYGSSSDLWGTTWSAEDINSSGFGVSLSVTQNGAGARIAYVDYISITVTYTPAGPDFLVDFSNLDFGYVYTGQVSDPNSFQLSGESLPELTGSIIVTAPSADFQVSNDGTVWGSTTTIPYTYPTLNATTVYSRFTPQTSGLKSGNVTFTIEGRISPTTVLLTGTGVTPASQLAFVGFPDIGAVNLDFQPFTVEARGSDNTIDYLYSGDITLARATGPGTVNGILTVTAAGGIATFSAVSVDQAGDYTLSASSGLLTQGISGTITVNVSAAGDYYSASSGTWGAGTTWNYNDGSGWVTPPSGPTSSSGKIYIVNGHIITVAASVNVDELTITSGGQVTVNSTRTLTIADGTGTDLSVNGTLVNSGSITMTGTAIFNGGSVYEHKLNGGTTIPAATWDIASTLLISGITNSTVSLGGLGQLFGNVTWNCPGQTALNGLANSNYTYNGTLTIVNTGTNAVQLVRPSFTGNVAHYVQTGGTAVIGNGSAAFNKRLNVTGNFSLSGGIFDTSNGSGTTSQIDELYIGGNFSISGGGTLLRRSSTNSNTASVSLISFNGNTIQYFSKSTGTISGKIDFSVNPTAIVDFGTSVLGGSSGTFTLDSGGTLITANAAGIASVEATGSIQVTGTRTFSTGGNYIYNGVVNQTTGSGLPATVNSLEVDNLSGVWQNGSLVLANNTTVTTALTVSSGILNLNGYTCDGSGTGILTVENGTTLLIGGSNNFPTNFSAVNLIPGSRVMYADYGDQTVYATTYHNLYLLGSGVKTTDGVSVNGILFLGGTATVSAASPVVYSSTASLQYHGTTAQTTGAEFPAVFNGSGGVLVNNSQGVILGADKEITDGLIIGESGLLDIGTYKLTTGELDNNGTITINSTSLTENGSFIPITIINGGTVIYNRKMHDSRYHYFSSPVATVTFPNTGTVWSWDEEAGDWAETTSCTSGIGYTMLTGGDLLNFTGTLVTGDILIEATSPYGDIITGAEENYDSRHFSGESVSYPLGHSGAVRSLTNYGGGGWNLLGNPFTSAMNVSAFIDQNYNVDPLSSQFDPNYVALYLYDGTDYSYVAKSTGWPGGTFLSEDYIQTGQGFYVLAMNDNSTFRFTRSMQGHDTDVSLLKSGKADNAWPGLLLKAKYGDNESSTLVIYNEQMNAGLDPGYDIGLFSSGSDVEIYTMLIQDNGINFARQALPLVDSDKKSIAVGIDSEKGGEVTFSATTVPLDNYKFWLEDRAAGIFTDLNTNTYTVTLPAKTYGTGRFFIIASTNTPTAIETPQAESPGVRIWTSNEKVIIKGEVSDKAICEIYDLRGKKIMETHLNDEELNTIDLPSGLHGVYLVRVVDGVKMTTRKVALL